MTITQVALNLVLLVPLTSALTFFVFLPTAKFRFLWIPLWCICVVPLGGFLTQLAVLAYGQTVTFGPFAWLDSPLFTAGVYLTWGAIGGFFSYGVACATGSALGWYKERIVGKTGHDRSEVRG